VLKVDYFIGLRPTHFTVSENSAHKRQTTLPRGKNFAHERRNTSTVNENSAHKRRYTSTGRKNPLPSASQDFLRTLGTVVYVF